MKKILYPSVVVLALMSAVGCSGSKDPNRPKTFPVSGVVTLGGTPVDGATVTFQLADHKGSSVGTTDASGKYQLSTFGGNDGARPGDYKISIVKYDRPAAQALIPGKLAPGGIDEKTYTGPETAGASQPAAPKNLLPEKYANVATSQLTAKVNETGKNQADFKLEP